MRGETFVSLVDGALQCDGLVVEFTADIDVSCGESNTLRVKKPYEHIDIGEDCDGDCNGIGKSNMSSRKKNRRG